MEKLPSYQWRNNRYLEALKEFEPADPQAGKIVDKLVRGMDRATVQALNQVVAQMEKTFKENIAGQSSQQTQQSAQMKMVFLVLPCWVLRLSSFYLLSSAVTWWDN